jgi:hypothetical protein
VIAKHNYDHDEVNDTIWTAGKNGKLKGTKNHIFRNSDHIPET